MSKKKKSGKKPVVTNSAASGAREAAKKKVNPLPIIAAAVAVVSIVVVILVNRNGAPDKNDSALNNTVNVTAGGSLVIPTADITSDVSFYPLKVDGTSMEVLAVKASDGTIRTAFNTCQSCYASGRGYYVQVGNDLVCQNCGFHFTPDDVEIMAGGCNPWPIFAENKTVSDDTISISYDFLTQAKIIFSKWKTDF